MMRRGLKLILIAVILFADATIVQGKNLLEFYDLAFQNDTAFTISELSLNSSRARLEQSISQMKPQIDISAKPKETRGTENFRTIDFNLTLTQSLFNYDRWNAIDEAEAYVAEEEAKFEDARQGLIVRVATAYFDFLVAKDDVELAKAEKQAIAQQLNQIRQRFNVGLSAITDVHEVQSAYDLAVAQEITAKSSMDNAREAIHEIAGQDLGNIASLKVDIPLTTPKPWNVDSWVELALQKSLDIVAQEAVVDALRESLSRANAGHLPTLSLVAGSTFKDTTGSLFGKNTKNTSIGVDFAFPIYSGGYTTAKVKEATYNLVKAQTTLEQIRRATVRQSRSAYLAVNAGIALVKARKQSVISAEALFKATQAGFEAGSRTTVDVLDAQRDLYRAENDFAHARYDYLLSILVLKEVVSNLQESDLASINTLLKETPVKTP